MPNVIDVLVATAGALQRELSSGNLTSVNLIHACLDQIKQHDGYLHVMITIAPRAHLIEQDQRLDDERKNNKIRGRLHGIPILVQDTIATSPELQMDTIAGSLALPLSARAIILGIKSHDSFAGHNNCAESSSDSAIGVSAGYAPISIGTETEASLILPAGRAALYTMKPTMSIISQEGIIPITRLFVSTGPMAKSVEDLPNLMDISVDPSKTDVPAAGYLSAVTAAWDGLKIGALDPEIWTYPESWRKSEPAAGNPDGQSAQIFRNQFVLTEHRKPKQ